MRQHSSKVALKALANTLSLSLTLSFSLCYVWVVVAQRGVAVYLSCVQVWVDDFSLPHVIIVIVVVVVIMQQQWQRQQQQQAAF